MNASNIINRTIFTGDNLPIMRGINSASVDLIYLDPPFNSNRDYAAPIGSPAEGAGFKDIWTLDDIKEVQVEELKGVNYGLHAIITAARYANGPSMTAYLTVMGIRLLEIHRLLKPTGTVYLHCDPTASHYIKGMMDAVFGPAGFRNEIVWSYAGGGIPKYDFPRKHDIILRYSKSDTRIFNGEAVRVPYASNYVATVFAGDATRAPGRTYTRNPNGKIVEDWWNDIPRPYGRERTGYPTQKPLALLERIIKASSNPGDLVLDPFCGCATACIAAEKLEREWAGIDIAPRALELTKTRLAQEVRVGSDAAPTLTDWEVTHRIDIPERTDGGASIPPPPLYAPPIPPPPSPDIRRILYGKQEGFCNGCDLHFRLRNLTLDHIVPRSRGGAHTDSNLQLLCQACNSKKGTRTQEEFLAILVSEGIRR